MLDDRHVAAGRKLSKEFARFGARIVHRKLKRFSEDAVGIKAKTNEGMGFVGRGEGVAVMAIATVEAR